MTDLRALADCILSGQVPDERVPSLVAQTPGLREELERRSRAMSPVLTGEAGRGDSVLPTQTSARPADPFADILFDDDWLDHDGTREFRMGLGITRPWTVPPDLDDAQSAALARSILDRLNPPNLPRQGPLPHSLGKEVSRYPLKSRGLLSQLIRSMHPPSFLRKLLKE